eukprot:3194472-Rhodomonas_salina.1
MLPRFDAAAQSLHQIVQAMTHSIAVIHSYHLSCRLHDLEQVLLNCRLIANYYESGEITVVLVLLLLAEDALDLYTSTPTFV